MQKQLFSVLGAALCCWLQALAEVPVQPDFQQEQFTGRWYSVALGSNSKWFKETKLGMKMCTTVVTPMEDGNLNVTSTYPNLDQCETRKSLFVRTEQPGHFSYTSARTGSLHDVKVVATDYDEYALLCIKKTKASESFTMVILYGRSKELRPDLLETFTRFSLAQGLTKDNLLILPPTDQCMAESA